MATSGYDPLKSYTPEELLDLVERQSFELDDLRAKSDQFEHLYVDIIQSTSWKLAWPIRAAFKVLTRVKKAVTGQKPASKNPASESSRSGSLAQDTGCFDASLVNLHVFSATDHPVRLNLLISVHLSDNELEHLVFSLASIALELELPLRILSLDPQLTARACQDIFRNHPQVVSSGPQGGPGSLHPFTLHTDAEEQSVDFTFHRIDSSAGAKGIFRLDFGPGDYLFAQTDQAARFVTDFIQPGNIIRLSESGLAIPDDFVADIVLNIRETLGKVTGREGKGS